MIRLKEMGKVSLVFVLIAVAVSSATEESEEINGRNTFSPIPFPFDRRLQYLLETRQQETQNNLKILWDIINFHIKHLLNNIKENNTKRTTCILDGGFSSSCNHQDAVEAGMHHKFLESSFSPGRRKRGIFKL